MSTTLNTSAPAVSFFSQQRSFEATWPELRERIGAVFDRGKYSHGAQVAILEDDIARFTGARYAIGVGSGTAALELLLRAAGIGPGDEVILPCFTWISPAAMVAKLGARPVFVDIERDSYTLDVDAVEAAITQRTRAILAVHLFCQLADLAGLRELAPRHELLLLEDSAEAIGMWCEGTHAGLVGIGGVLSFFPTKTLGTLGDAGMILTNDPAIGDRCRILRHHGRLGTTIDRISGISNAAGISGTNSKMDEILAAILVVRLTRLARDIALRAAWAERYDTGLEHLGEVVRTPRLVRRAVACSPAWYVYTIEALRRDELAAHLASRGVGTEQYYPRPLHLQPCFAKLGGRAGQHPVAERACERTLALPLYPDLTVEQVDTVIAGIEEFYAE